MLNELGDIEGFENLKLYDALASTGLARILDKSAVSRTSITDLLFLE